jgi:F-box-like
MAVWVGRVTIDIPPDDVLLLIFHFDRLTYLDEPRDFARMRYLFWKWHLLVHVCRRWRSVVFGSPNFLDLRLVCDPRTRLELIDIWHPFPIIITNLLDGPIPRICELNHSAVVHHSQINLF